MRDYVQRNFVDKEMCADWVIHDNENDKGQRNLHIHVLLTIRPITENGEWGAKQKKIYDLDENDERIPVIDKKIGQQKVEKRNRKQWKCHTADSTDWNSRENAKIKNMAVSVKNEIMEMIAKVREHKSRLDLLIVSGQHLRKISDRTASQSADNAEKFITTRKIDSFESLAKFTADREQKYQQLETVQLSKGKKLNRLKELSKMYTFHAPIQATYKESQSLKGLAKMRYDKDHKDSLSKHSKLKERMPR